MPAHCGSYREHNKTAAHEHPSPSTGTEFGRAERWPTCGVRTCRPKLRTTESFPILRRGRARCAARKKISTSRRFTCKFQVSTGGKLATILAKRLPRSYSCHRGRPCWMKNDGRVLKSTAGILPKNQFILFAADSVHFPDSLPTPYLVIFATTECSVNTVRTPGGAIGRNREIWQRLYKPATDNFHFGFEHAVLNAKEKPHTHTH